MTIDPGSRCSHSTIRSNQQWPHDGTMSDRGSIHNSATGTVPGRKRREIEPEILSIDMT